MWKQVFNGLSPGGSRSRLPILIFHRVIEHRDPLFPGEVTQQEFDAMCGWLRHWFNVMPLVEAAPALKRGTLPARALSITFDDGYADNERVALPVLCKHGLTATFFVASGFLDGGRMWNDTVIEAVRHCGTKVLDLSDMPDLACAQVWGLDDNRQRRRAIDAIVAAVKYLDPPERLRHVQGIAARSGAALPDDLMMSSDQVRRLHQAGMTIGAHTVSHPILARLEDAPALAEITRGRQVLQQITGSAVDLFAYPNGKPGDDYTDATVDLVASIGFSAAVSTRWGAACAADHPFQLPRFTPWDRTRQRFALRMARTMLGA